MKVIVKEKGSTKKSYPKLMIYPEDSTIVLFSAYGAGICVRAGGNTELGYQTTFFAMDKFEDFDGEVTLSND